MEILFTKFETLFLSVHLEQMTTFLFVGQAFVELFVAVGRLVVIPRRLGIENGSSRLCAHLADVDGGAVAEGARVTVPVT